MEPGTVHSRKSTFPHPYPVSLSLLLLILTNFAASKGAGILKVDTMSCGEMSATTSPNPRCPFLVVSGILRVSFLCSDVKRLFKFVFLSSEPISMGYDQKAWT